MVNILLEGYDIGADWLHCVLSNYIMPEHKVAIVAFSFRDSRVKSAADWDALYGREGGRFYGGITGGFMKYGVREQNISFINYFADSHEDARRAIKQADIIYFPGGLPDRMMDRIDEFGIHDVLAHHEGVIMGYSAGAVIQLSEYHLSPDDDYPEFGYYRGLGYLDGFYLEVHYENTAVQNAAIRRVLAERGAPVYATQANSGAIIVDNGRIITLGNVHKEKTL